MEETPLEKICKIGEAIERNGQRYVFLGVEPYTNRHGEEVDLYNMTSNCRTCGDPFRIKVVPSTRFWNARCPWCIRAGRNKT